MVKSEWYTLMGKTITTYLSTEYITQDFEYNLFGIIGGNSASISDPSEYSQQQIGLQEPLFDVALSKINIATKL